MEVTSSFIVELFLVCAFACLACGQSCPSQKPTLGNFTVCIQRNQTGHWIPQFRIEHRVGDNIVTITPWTADAEHNTASYSGVDPVHVVPKMTAPPPSAGPGYELHPGVGYYKYHSDPKNWHEARMICAKEGGHLAIINSEEESIVLWNIVAGKQHTSWVFIGFHDLYLEGQYLTIFDEPLDSTGFYRWYAPHEPNNTGDDKDNVEEDCGSIHPNGGLNDLACGAKHPFICEQELWLDPSADLTDESRCHKNSDSPSSSGIFPEFSPEQVKN